MWKTHVEGVALGGGSGKRKAKHGTSRDHNHATSQSGESSSSMEEEQYQGEEEVEMVEEEYGWAAAQDVESSRPNHLLVRNGAVATFIISVASQICIISISFLLIVY